MTLIKHFSYYEKLYIVPSDTSILLIKAKSQSGYYREYPELIHLNDSKAETGAQFSFKCLSSSFSYVYCASNNMHIRCIQTLLSNLGLINYKVCLLDWVEGQALTFEAACRKERVM